MANPFLAEIRIFAGNFAPRGWAQCDGQLLPISQNTALFSLLGTTYGGNGTTTFALPDLQGRAPMHAGQGPGLSQRDLGEAAGEQYVTLLQTEIPVHSHTAQALAAKATLNSPAGATWAQQQIGRQPLPAYSTNAGTAPAMSPQAVGVTGGSQPHNNLMPYLGLTFIIALQGVYPARS